MYRKSSIPDGGQRRRDPAAKIVDEVAQAKDVDSIDLTPIQSVIDAGALNNLYARSASDIEVTFEYEGYRVTVRGDGDVHLDK